jgi:hypothetical protein
VGDRIGTSSACFQFDLNEPHRGWRELRWSMRTERFKARSIVIDKQWYIMGKLIITTSVVCLVSQMSMSYRDHRWYTESR